MVRECFELGGTGGFWEGKPLGVAGVPSLALSLVARYGRNTWILTGWWVGTPYLRVANQNESCPCKSGDWGVEGGNSNLFQDTVRAIRSMAPRDSAHSDLK